MDNYDLAIKDAKKILIGLLMLEIFFVAAYGFNTFFGTPIVSIKILFDLDSEGSLPAWFSATQLFLIGLAFLIKSRIIDLHHSPSPYFFLLMGLGFIFLSADEAAAIHEKITIFFKHIKAIPRFKGNHGIWIVVYILIAIVLLLSHFKYLISMWRSYRKETIILGIGMAALVCGGVFLEIVSYQFLRTGLTPISYSIEVMAEEFLEMFGATIVLYGAVLVLFSRNKST
jgi:hypothetical protein